MAQQVHTLSLGPLTAHAFNADRSQVAVCPNSNEVLIYIKDASGSWSLQHTLSEHDKLVTGIDWAPKTNRIVTCSQDRNAYVWTPIVNTATGSEEWKPTLVLLRINRAATFARWSPNEDKFAVASGARIVAICSFEEDNDWWVAKHIKKPLRSTVLSLDWHPNNVLIACGSADMKARVFSAFIKGVDAKPPPSVWGERLPFGTVCAEFRTPAGGWVHGTAFSPSGDAVAFVGHDSSLTVAYPSGPDSPPHAIHVIRSAALPHVTLTFISENALVAAGHGCQPILFEGDAASGWKASKTLDAAGAAAGKGAPPPPPPKAPGLATVSSVGRLNNEAFNRFKAADAKGASAPPTSGATAGGSAGAFGAVAGASLSADGELHTTHQNTITSIRPYQGAAGAVSAISTSGVDGRLCVFNVNAGASLAKAMGSLRV
ncbi:actin-like protein ARPC3 [Tilletiaria anomala UBC 951]|uniref:Arp2/3 complex 41 kDa subunit n=1 Tax=Tilletiaria anomala (strain ATCC 24038 / CBS 436.72 / UBC 951) TaxID=1037660 RepID=A0A066VS69_TILAU|nr:actin-like protein ARPC3 [Tilletiaria anomala UBC 951]KDN44577.1 actin-like protein ARPC3 [Tilletiaria anomala UBC 951]